MKVSNVDAAMAALRQTLSRTSRRTEAVASNLANVDTPGYRALDVDFPELLLRAGNLRRSDPGHLAANDEPRLRGVVVEAPVTRVRNDGNTVDIDREMTLLSMLQGRYRASTEMVRKRFALWMYAATDGRG